MILRLVLGLTLFCTGCSAADTSDAGVDAGVDAGIVWSWSGSLTGVGARSTTLVGSVLWSCSSGWYVDIASRRFDFDECPRGGSTMGRTGQRALTEEDLNRFVAAMGSMQLATPQCNNETGWSTMDVTTSASTTTFNLGDSRHCPGTDLIIVHFLPVISLTSDWSR